MPVLATFLVAAPDQPGLVARFAGFFAERSLNIVDATNHSDEHGSRGTRFFMRVVVDVDALGGASQQAPKGARVTLEQAFDDVARALEATWSVGYSDVVAKLAVLVTTEESCLYDLALRERSGELPGKIVAVISNRPALKAVAEGFQLPFFVLPVTPETKRAQEEEVIKILRQHQVDLVVLARYMQIVSEEFLTAAPPVINIHHGFLPAFQGGKPYHQAYERGVKLVGATAHFATKDLDQGPIIEQDVVRVTHAMNPIEMARRGRDVERVVLARAVRAQLERRVIVDGQRTVVL